MMRNIGADVASETVCRACGKMNVRDEGFLLFLFGGPLFPHLCEYCFADLATDERTVYARCWTESLGDRLPEMPSGELALHGVAGLLASEVSQGLHAVRDSARRGGQ